MFICHQFIFFGEASLNFFGPLGSVLLLIFKVVCIFWIAVHCQMCILSVLNFLFLLVQVINFKIFHLVLPENVTAPISLLELSFIEIMILLFQQKQDFLQLSSQYFLKYDGISLNVHLCWINRFIYFPHIITCSDGLYFQQLFQKK